MTERRMIPPAEISTMAMATGSSSGPNADINVTPLIDVLLVMLIERLGLESGHVHVGWTFAFARFTFEAEVQRR